MEKEKEKMIRKFDSIMKNSRCKSKEDIMKELFNEDNRTEEDNRNSSNASKSKALNHIEENKEEQEEKEDNGDTFLTNIANNKITKEVKEESIVEEETNDKRPEDNKIMEESGIPFNMKISTEKQKLKKADKILKKANNEAKKNGLQDMSLDEINSEIKAYRMERHATLSVAEGK